MLHMLLQLAVCLTWNAPLSLALPQDPALMDAWARLQLSPFLAPQSSLTRSVSAPQLDASFNTDALGLGTVSGVDVDSNGDLFIFHRGNRPWVGSTFTSTNELTQEARAPITEDTILKVSATDARLISSFAGNMFNVPHGLRVDHNDNVWVTDVGRHQVLRFPKNGTTPDLTVGEKFVPGSDLNHFCKPTGVAVERTGEFFVSDGYCNRRLLKFSAAGEVLMVLGTPESNTGLRPPFMNLPHSVALLEQDGIVCVADRENQRALCYRSEDGQFRGVLVQPGEMGAVFSLYYNSADGTMVASGQTSSRSRIESPRAFTYNMYGEQLERWAYSQDPGSSLIHDVCVSADGRHFFMAEIYQRRVTRYTRA